MSDHLPECHLTLEPRLSAKDWCICIALRACEARMREEFADHARHMDYSAEERYRRGLDAAREAVAALRISPQDWDHTSAQSYGDIRHEARQDALAAIDALRGGHA